MQKTTLSTILALAAAVTLAACSQTSSTSSTATATDQPAASPAASAPAAASPGDSDTADAIKSLVAAEDNGFSDIQGKAMGGDADTAAYAVSSTVPNMSCTMLLLKKSNEKAVDCVATSTTQADADAALAAAKQNVAAAMPSLTGKDVNSTSGKYIAQWLYSDDKHAVLLYEKKKSENQYVVSMSFALPSFFNS